ncbi:MAG: glycoside hydrolase, family 3-like [Novosphingobium sp.]|nr:glycoside hydrolase, family 3-like [Novosphingobium sp.]
MHSRPILRAALLAASAISLSPVAHAEPSRAAAPDDAVVSARARALLAQMTPAEKAGQLTDFFYFGQLLPALGAAVETEVAKANAGALLFTTDPATINRVQKIAVEQTRLKIPLLFGFDVIHGLRTIFPAPLGMAASWDPALAERSQAVAAAEARSVGVHWTFAPMVDIARDPRWGRIFEGAGEDPYLGSAMAAAQVRGFQGPYLGAPGHIIAGPKHFAGYGAAIGGRDYDEVEISDSQLWNVYLPPFKAAIDAGAGNIMSAYMGLNGIPATANRWLLTDVLRREWGFKGFVVSDSGAVNSLTTQGLTTDGAAAAVAALKAGTNMEMVPPGQTRNMGAIPAAVAAGVVSASELDAAVLPILETKFRMGLFENPYVDIDQAERVLNDPAHRTAARVAAERSVVLLKNAGSLLPLDRRAIKSIAVIGPLADSARDIMGSWVFAFNKPSANSILAALRAKIGSGIQVTSSEGVRLPARLNPSPFGTIDGIPPKRAPLDESAEIARATELARAADVTVMVLGEDQEMSGETASRASFELPGRQQELLDAVVKTGKPVVVMLMSVRPLSLHDTKAAAIMDIWYPGSEGGSAVANLLFGDAVPGGKLPITWIRSAAQAPMTYAHQASHDPANTNKRYWDTSSEPTYPFGFGLSYSTFSYTDLKVDRPRIAQGGSVTVSVALKNTGMRQADEVAQLYIHQKSGSSARPVRELKGFRRVSLKPGELRTLEFQLGPDELRYWNAAKRDWVIDESVFEVAVGGDSTAPFGTSFAVAQRP